MTHKRTVNGRFSCYETPWGCMKDIASQFHVYIRDCQGKILTGLPHGDAMGASANRHKFGGKGETDPKAADFRHLSPWAYCAGDPVNNTDPTGMSTHVIGIGNGRYEVVGGNLKDNDLGIYVVKPGLGLFAYYVRTGERIGVTTSITSFYNSDEEAWAVGNIIDMNDNSGMSFLRDITENPPSLLYYMSNATTNGKYDFKATGNNHIYRGMPIGTNECGLTVITSARDIGNIGAGYVAGYHGVTWSDARIGFDAYEFQAQMKFEGLSTRNAERVGWEWGMANSSILGRYSQINSPLMPLNGRLAMYLLGDLYRIIRNNPWK